ncbi:tetratricopeptide repeat protein [Emticicia sp. 17c]|uniref:tetratricopeptide repeat protein n=1 Tax=Emticicia sp. 17c TaxID=3127704 RepID=UPI00301DC5AD
MRLYLLSCVSVLVSTGLLAQQPVFRSQSTNIGVFSSNTVHTTKPNSFIPESDKKNTKKRFAPTGLNIHLMPLFGGYDKTDSQKAIDEEFLKVCDANFKTRKEASEFFSQRAWEYLSEGQKDTATYRFNLAYLLDDENVDVYWGLGVIDYQNEKYEDAVALMLHGLELDDEDNTTLMVDLSTVYLRWFIVDKKDEHLQEALSLLNKAIQKTPESANAYMQMSLAKLFNNQLDEAWNNFHKGYELDPQNANPEILQALLDKKDDPRGIFKKGQ